MQYFLRNTTPKYDTQSYTLQKRAKITSIILTTTTFPNSSGFYKR